MEELIKQLEDAGLVCTVSNTRLLVADDNAKLYGIYDRDTADFNQIIKDFTFGGVQ